MPIIFIYRRGIFAIIHKIITMNVNHSEDILHKSKVLLELMQGRRSVRHYSNKSIPIGVIKNCISIAASAPNEANMQPWSFVVVQNPENEPEGPNILSS